MRPGDDLAPLPVAHLTVREAPPSPPPGPVREALARAAAERAERAERTLVALAETYAERLAGVALARLRGPKARKGTRYWSDRVKSADPVTDSVGSRPMAHLEGIAGPTTEVKALDPDYIVSDNLIRESVEILRPGVEQVARDAAEDAANRIVGGTSTPDGMFAVDEDLLGDLIDEALEDLLGMADRYAAELRTAIRDGEAADMDLDDLVEYVDEAAQRGGNWLRLNARTVATALAGKTQLESARALGVTHTQWISRRDGRVRPTHVAADGQVRPIGEAFRVGGFELQYPGDPTGLPATAGEVHNCRCGLIFATVDDDLFAALTEIAASALADLSDEPPPGVDPLLDAAAVAVAAALARESELPYGADDVASFPAPESVTGWRVLDAPLDVAPGQHVSLPAGTSLGLVAPADLTAETLAVLVPAGTAVRVAGGTLVLVAATEVQVLAAGAAGVQSRVAP